MDHTLRDNRFSNNSTSFNALFRNAGGLACRILVAALALPALMSTGCQTGQFASSKIPVPSTTLDKSRFENVRFQSLDEFGPFFFNYSATT